jgi:excinuclease ABC subunit A
VADRLVVRGAREHNLKDIAVDLPRDSLVVFTGLSGSGKSSLAFDTIFAEGQRRYVESLSAYARQFLGQMDKPDVDFIEGLSPAVSIDQKSTNRNPRSTVGTITEIHDYLRLLYARAGRPHCVQCGQPIGRQTPQQIVDRLLQLPDGTRFQVLAPVVRGRKGENLELFRDMQGRGFSRARVDGEVVSLAEPPALEPKKKHDVDIVVDRLVSRSEGDVDKQFSTRRRLTDSVETALGLAEGMLVVELIDVPQPGTPGAEDHPLAPRERRFSERLACPEDHPVALEEIEPRTFSFNGPYGACPQCSGLGIRLEVDPELVVPDDDLSLRQGAVAPWASGSQSVDYFDKLLSSLADALGFSMDTPWRALPERARNAVLHGLDGQLDVRYKTRHGRQRAYRAGFEGVVPFIRRRHTETDSEWAKDRYGAYMREVPCPVCHGARLRPEVLAVTVAGRNIAEVSSLTIGEAAGFLRGLELTEREHAIADRVLREIHARLGFLLDVGLDYLSLDRAAGTLSGGEAQRIRLATQIGAGLVGVLYVLDEPSIGLHQRDNQRLIGTLTRLRDLGNTLIVVEHDEDTIKASDWVVDIGPGAGEHGGQVVHSGPLAELLTNSASLTGAYLSGRRSIPTPSARRAVDPRACCPSRVPGSTTSPGWTWTSPSASSCP